MLTSPVRWRPHVYRVIFIFVPPARVVPDDVLTDGRLTTHIPRPSRAPSACYTSWTGEGSIDAGGQSLDDRRFGVSDLLRWAEDGFISRNQARNILREEGLDDTGSAIAGAEVERGLNVITLFSYFGAFLALTGLAVFASVNWGDLAPTARVAMLIPVTFRLLATGYYLRS